MGEGGAIVINNGKYIEKAEILREKGTNRSQFYRGQVAKYNWIDFGDSYLPSDLNAAYLWAQLELIEEINNNRLATWKTYYDALLSLEKKGLLKLPTIIPACRHNAHMFYIKLKNLDERTKFINFMKEKDVLCVFHYVPLHSAPAGKKFGIFFGDDEYTTKESDRLVRLPLYYNINKKDFNYIIACIYEFFGIKHDEVQ